MSVTSLSFQVEWGVYFSLRLEYDFDVHSGVQTISKESDYSDCFSEFSGNFLEMSCGNFLASRTHRRFGFM